MKRMRLRGSAGAGAGAGAGAYGTTSAEPGSWASLLIRTTTVGLLACGLTVLGTLLPGFLLEGGSWRERDVVGRMLLALVLAVGYLVMPMFSSAALALVQGLNWIVGAALLPAALVPLGGYLALLSAAGEGDRRDWLWLTLCLGLAIFQGLLLLQAYANDDAANHIHARHLIALLALSVALIVGLLATAPLVPLTLLAWGALPLCTHVPELRWPSFAKP